MNFDAPWANRIARVVQPHPTLVSEPLGDLAGAWNEVPDSSYGVVQQGQDEVRPFTPGRS